MALPLIILLFMILIFHSARVVQLAAGAGDAANYSSSFLELSLGLHLSIPPSYNPPYGAAQGGDPIATDLMFTVGMPILDQGGIFFPILSSPSFNSSNSSQSRGFSLGFYFSGRCEEYNGCNNIYLAVCAGSSGNYTSRGSGAPFLITSNKSFFWPYQTLDGFVVPVWTANLNRPIRYADSASLMVDFDSMLNRSELRLMDGNEVVWNVSINVGNIMELQETTGKLFIYDSSVSRTSNHVVWQSPDPDTLIEGQRLMVGGPGVTSNDSSYSARMEKGGLLLYINTLHFNMALQQPPPYWIFPLLRPNDTKLPPNASVNQLISSAPCSTSPAYTTINVEDSSFINLSLSPGSCRDGYYFSTFASNASWSFLRLESDGRLYTYAVSNPIGAIPSAMRFALDSAPGTIADVDTVDFSASGSPVPFFYDWGKCDVPMACGPLGVCTPGAITPCSCHDSFHPINVTDSYQGCKPSTSLPLCNSGNEHINSTDFMQVNSTASIFLFNGWTFNSTHAHDVDVCKHSCSSNCSCHGFCYQVDTSACYFITDEISLLAVADKTLYFFNYFLSNPDDFSQTKEVLARNYVTYLKVVTTTSPAASQFVTPHGNKAAMIALITILLSIVACFALGLAGHLLRARKRKLLQMSMQAKEESDLQEILPLLPSRFSYKDLHEATKRFSKLLGAGGCGSVYAGILRDGRKVAVKALQVAQGTVQSKQFLAEVATIGRTNHHNIVRLVGFCWEASQRLLVYEYVERGSLDRWLFRSATSNSAALNGNFLLAPLLDWQTRYKVVLGVARGLHYLHEECEHPILHFDIKPQNILLGDEFVAKMADFGMSRLMQRDTSSVVTGVRGTPGYIAPEWFSHGTVSKKSDVYSMGMVMLEIVGGRKILDYSVLLNNSLNSEEQEAWHFPSWAATKCEQGLMMEIVDKSLEVCGFDREQARRLIHIAFWCIHEDPAMRPNVPTVVQWLEDSSPIKQPPFSAAVKLNSPPN